MIMLSVPAFIVLTRIIIHFLSRYLDKQEFLQRADVRQFELEREERLKRFRRMYWLIIFTQPYWTFTAHNPSSCNFFVHYENLILIILIRVLDKCIMISYTYNKVSLSKFESGDARVQSSRFTATTVNVTGQSMKSRVQVLQARVGTERSKSSIKIFQFLACSYQYLVKSIIILL